MSNWNERESARFQDGTYRHVPWRNEQFWLLATCKCEMTDEQMRARGISEAEISIHATCAQHFAHVSTEDPSKLAYTPDERHGREDRQLSTRPGRYLGKYLSAVLDPQTIQSWAGKFAAENEPQSLKLATEPDDIVRVYAVGPRSCMSEMDCVRVYGAGDLAVAYLERDGKVTARCVAWPSKRLHCDSIYGDRDRLRAALRSEGYETGRFDSARLLLIREGSHIVAPYMDGGYYASVSGEYLVLGRSGDCHLSNTGGYVNAHTCDSCGEPCDDLYRVSGDEWCESCVESDAWRCDSCEELHSSSEPQTTVDGERDFCTQCRQRYATQCDYCAEYVSDNDIVQVGDSEFCSTCAEDKAGACVDCGDVHELDCLEDTDDGSVCAPCAEERESEVASVRASAAERNTAWVRELAYRGADVPIRVGAEMHTHKRTPHPMLFAWHRDSGEWTLTHGPTGLAVGISSPSLRQARRIAYAIALRAPDMNAWGFTSAAWQLPPDEQQVLRDAIGHARTLVDTHALPYLPPGWIALERHAPPIARS